MTNLKRLGAGFLLASTALSVATMAHAQIAPGADTTVQPSASATGQSVGQPLESFALVRGEPESFTVLVPDDEGNLVRRPRPRPPGAARAFVREDEMSVVSRTEWQRNGWSMESFDAVRQNNQHFCSVTANYIVRAASLAERYAATEPRVAAIKDRYVNMAGDIRNAGRTRLGSNVFSSALAWIFGTPLTGAFVTSGAIGNEAQGRAWDRSMMLSRDAGVLNAELTGLHVEFNLMSLEMYADYLGLVNGYCTTVFATDNLSTLSVSSSYTPAPRAGQ